MTFTSIASTTTQPADSDLTVLKTAKLSKVSVATSLLAIVGVTVLQNLLWMSASHPAELPTHTQTVATSSELTTTK
jgi:hypothetical protein